MIKAEEKGTRMCLQSKTYFWRQFICKCPQKEINLLYSIFQSTYKTITNVFASNSWDWETTSSITKANVPLVRMTSSTSSQLSSMLPCQPQMHQKLIRLHRLRSRKVGQSHPTFPCVLLDRNLNQKPRLGVAPQVCWIRRTSSWKKPPTCMEECVTIYSPRPVTATASWPKWPSCRGRQPRYCNTSQLRDHISVQLQHGCFGFHIRQLNHMVLFMCFHMQSAYNLRLCVLNISVGIHSLYIDILFNVHVCTVSYDPKRVMSSQGS